MAIYTVAEFLRRGELHYKQLEDLRAELNTLKEQHQARIVEAKAELEDARARLAELYLPAFTLEALQSAARLTGFDELATQEPFTRRDQEVELLRRRLEEIAGDDRFQHPNRYVHPDAGEYTRALIEAQGYLDTWTEPLSRLEGNTVFIRLLTHGYKTDRYFYRWWHPFYYRDWREADELVEELGKQSFEEVLAEYHKAKDHFEKWSAVARDMEARIAEVNGLQVEYQEKQHRLENIDRFHLEDNRERLLRDIEPLAPSILAGLAQDRTIEAQLKQVDGIRAKVSYLEGMSQYQLEADERALGEAASKTLRAIQKMQRPKHFGSRFTEAELEARFPDRREKYEGRWRKFDRSANTVHHFHHYDRGSVLGDILWWDVMTDGRLNGRFLPEVQSFYDSHPGYTYQPAPEEDREDVQDAAVAALMEDRSDDAAGWGDAS